MLRTLAVDAVAFSKRGSCVRLALSDHIRTVVADVAVACGIGQDACHLQNRGDAAVAVFSTRESTALLLTDLLRALALSVPAEIATDDGDVRVRIRVSLHDGDVAVGGQTADDDVLAALRLLDSEPVLAALRVEETYVVLVVSDDVHRKLVSEESDGLEADDFRQVKVRAQHSAARAWLHASKRARPVPSSSAEPGPVVVSPSARGWDFFVSCAAEDDAWGEWISWQLEDAGYRVHLEAWEAVAGTHYVHRLDDAVSHSTRTVVVLSSAYLRSDRLQAEWHAAWRADPLGVRRSLIPIRVEDCHPGGLLQGIREIDLGGLDGDHARASLLAAIAASLSDRSFRPGTPPPFPRKAGPGRSPERRADDMPQQP